MTETFSVPDYDPEGAGRSRRAGNTRAGPVSVGQLG